MSALVTYSSSSDDEEGEEEQNSSVSQTNTNTQLQYNGASLPPLPTEFRNLYTTNVRVSNVDDPALHSGRQRQIPHVEGNWPSHIYTEWHPNDSESQTIQTLIDKVSAVESASKWHSSLINDLGVTQPLHISLSQTLQIPTDQRERVLEAITRGIKGLDIGAFTLQPDKLKYVSNYTKTRTFLVLSVGRPDGDELNCLLRVCNRVLAEFGFSALYSDRSDGEEDFSRFFHLSVAWRLAGSSADDLRDVLDEVWAGEAGRECRKISVAVDSVLFKIGNVVHSIKLGSQLASNHHKKRRLASNKQ